VETIVAQPRGYRKRASGQFGFAIPVNNLFDRFFAIDLTAAKEYSRANLIFWTAH
jgi:hypothetical protein